MTNDLNNETYNNGKESHNDSGCGYFRVILQRPDGSPITNACTRDLDHCEMQCKD